MSKTEGSADRLRLVKEHYGAWADSYGDSDDDGLFSFVRRREMRMVSAMASRSFAERAGPPSVLDAGCGPALHSRSLKTRGAEVWAVDCAPEMVERARPFVDEALVADLQELDLGRRFDLILCLGVMDFVSDPQEVFRRLRAHLSEGGRLIVLAPRRGLGGLAYRRAKAGHGLTVTLYDQEMFRQLAAGAGLAVEELRYPFVHNILASFRG